MAGIGFELKKLFKDQSGLGYVKAYTWTGIVTTGPFFIMVFLILGIQSLYDYFEVERFTKSLYISSVVYPFIFSHIVASGFTMLATRYISDNLYDKKSSSVLSSLFGIIAITLTVGGLIGIAFFTWAQLDFFIELTTYIFFMEMMVVQLLNAYVSALRDYVYIVASYAYGVAFAIVGTWLVLMLDIPEYVLVATMCFMDLGIFIIAALLFRNIFLFFGRENYRDFDFLPYFSTKKIVFFTNLFYTLGLYIHNLIIWCGPMGLCLADTYYYQPPYDTSTFYAYISILPAMMLFIVATETNFYDKYKRYLMFITDKGNYKEISDSRNDMVSTMWSEIYNIFDFQLVSTFCFLALGNIILPKVGLAFYGVDIYNLLVLSAFAIGILQAVIIMLFYLEDRVGAFISSAILLVCSIVFNTACVYLGESTYGFGAFAAAFIAMVYAICRLHYYSKRIDYYIFCGQPVLNVPETGYFVRLHEKYFKEKVKDEDVK